MEEKLLADVFDNDMHVRLDAGERLTDYFRKADSTPDAFPDLERLIGGLASWLNSSNFKVSTWLWPGSVLNSGPAPLRHVCVEREDRHTHAVVTPK